MVWRVIPGNDKISFFHFILIFFTSDIHTNRILNFLFNFNNNFIKFYLFDAFLYRKYRKNQRIFFTSKYLSIFYVTSALLTTHLTTY